MEGGVSYVRTKTRKRPGTEGDHKRPSKRTTVPHKTREEIVDDSEEEDPQLETSTRVRNPTHPCGEKNSTKGGIPPVSSTVDVPPPPGESVLGLLLRNEPV